MRTSRWILAAWLLTSAVGCGHTGFVELAEPVPPAAPEKPLPVYAARDIGRPYVVLGYVFRTTEGHRSGLEPINEHMYVMSPMAEEMLEVRRQALARGADAIVGLELFPTLNGWGQPVGFSVGGLAVKFTESAAARENAGPPSPTGAAATTANEQAPVPPPADAPAVTPEPLGEPTEPPSVPEPGTAP